MASRSLQRWNETEEQLMRDFYSTLSEKEQRRFAAVQARQFGHGGIKYVSEVLGCSRRRIERGNVELASLPYDPAEGRVRKSGAGRKTTITPDSEVEQNLKTMLETRTAGDPDDDALVFTDLSPVTLAEKLANLNTPVSGETIRKWLEREGLRLRKISKTIAGGDHPDRNAQFENLARLTEEYREAGNPCFSVDTKAKEFLGQLYRKGRVRANQAFRALDHDFPSWAEGVLVPHGIYDLVRNRGHLNLGLSRDTTQFACDSLKWYWNRIGKLCYPNATSILLLCDCGGSNSAHKYIFKHDLQALVDAIGVEIRVAHYPSYCSKYNPIERRFFSHVSRACTGRLFDRLETVVELMRRAATRTGLKTTVNVIRRCYEAGRQATEEIKNGLKIVFDDLMPKWNYRAVPQMRH